MRIHIGAVSGSLVVLAGCGSSAASEGAAVTTTAATTSSSAMEVSTTTTEATTTSTESTTTTTEATTTTARFEDQLADGLISLGDLPEGYVAEFENGMYLDDETLVVGDYEIEACDGEVEEQPASDARLSRFSYPTGTLGWPDEGVFEEVAMAVRVATDGTFDTVDRLEAAMAFCNLTEVSHPLGAALIVALEVEERDGVTGSGFQLVFGDGEYAGRSSLTYVLQIGRLDAYLFMSGAAPSLADLPSLAEPIVAAAQQHLAGCADDTQVCAP